jgi:hypothetical protein
MKFTDKLNEYVLSLEQNENTPVVPEPTEQKPEKIKQEVAPEGYTEMVRLLAKALVMNVPPDTIDNLFTTKITGENVETIREGLEYLINTSSNYQDNPERLQNPNFLKFYNSINENNFYNKFKELVSAMKKFSNDIDIK